MFNNLTKHLRLSGMIMLLLASGLSAENKAAKPKATAGTASLRVAMRDGLRFDPPRLKVNPGDAVTLELENADSTHQPHNFILTLPGKRNEVVKMALEMAEKGPARQFVPESPAILAHSDLLAPDKTQRLRFTAPAEPGVYPYMCTFPGHGLVMYGALYVGVPMPPIHEDPNLPEMLTAGLVCGGGRRPFVQRMFMPDAGPASIAVALPGEQNFCWDSTACRLRYIWSGKFIDAGEHWRGNGSKLARVPAEPWWRASRESAPLCFGSADAEPPSLTFRGYRLEEGIPVFRYRAGDTDVTEKITASTSERAVSIRYRMEGAQEPVFMSLSPAPGFRWSTTAGKLTAEHLKLTPEEAADFTLTLSASHE